MNILSNKEKLNTIRIGLLHSLTGTMANSEKPLLDAEMMAIDEINSNGGILGQLIEPIIADGRSNPDHFANLSKDLLESGVNCLFGCWTSASRKAVRPVVEQYNSQLFYPIQYEGLEESTNICYTGSCLNQQIFPVLEWAIEQFGRRIFLIGSDYVFPRTANYLIRSFVEQLNAEVVYEYYVPLGSQNFNDVINNITKLKPSFVINTINGESNFGFYHLCHQAGIRATATPIIATSISEIETQSMSISTEGHYACWSYFQSINNMDNHNFVNNFKSRYGNDRVLSDPMVTAYCQIYLWKTAVEKAGTFDIDKMRKHLIGCSMHSLIGDIAIQPNMHLSKPLRIGKICKDGQFEIVYNYLKPIDPLPWLGIENLNFPGKSMVQQSLKAFADNINYNILLEKEILDRKNAEKLAEEQAIRLVKNALDKKRVAQIIQYQNTVTELACLDAGLSLYQKLDRITELSAQAINVERVSIWFFDDKKESISTENIFINSIEKHIPGMLLKKKDYPIYFTALDNTNSIVSNFPLDDPRTNEFAEGYLKPLCINSVMDISINYKGDTIGIICFEHVGSKRIWGSEEQAFALSMSKIISMHYELNRKSAAKIILTK